MLTPSQNVTELKFSETGDGRVLYQVMSPGSSLTTSGSGTFGGTATLTATLFGAAGAPLAGEPVTFNLLNGSTPEPQGIAITNAEGVATLGGVSLADFPAGISPGARHGRIRRRRD